MRNLYGFFLCTLLIILNASQTHAFKQTGYEIKDLHETSQDLFQKEVKHWKIFDVVSNDTIRIVPYFGFILRAAFLPKAGPDLSSKYGGFERVYTDLPPHNTVGITGIFWYFDKNKRDPSECFASLSIGSGYDFNLPTIVPSPTYIEDFEKEDDFFLAIDNRFKYVNHHENSTLIIRINSLIQEDPLERSFGFREITIHFSNFSRRTEHSMMCHDKSRGIWSLTLNECPCALNEVPALNEVCQSCAKNCKVCFGPEPLQCLSCDQGTHWDGKQCSKCHPNCQTCNALNEHSCQVCTFGFYNYRNGTCSETCESPFHKIKGFHEHYCRRGCGPGEYEWNNDNTCLAECNFPLIKSTRENGAFICYNPCSRPDFLYTNGSCLSICPAPLLAVFLKAGKFCKNPCQADTEYLYSNRSCLKECPLPLQIKSEPGVNYCINPCHSPSLYLYSNGSCLSSCRGPLRARSEFGVKYCQIPCDLTREYILNDGSCSKDCPPPLIQRIEPSIGTYCTSPCESANHFILNNDGSCGLNCPSFFEVRREYGAKYCINPCLPDQYYFVQNKSCLERCPYPLEMELQIGEVKFCDNPCPKSFLYDDQSCHESCPLPLINQEGKYCKSPCQIEYVSEDGSCRISCDYPFEASQKGPYKLCMARRMTAFQLLQVDSIKQSVDISTAISRIGGVLEGLLNAGDPTSMLMMPLLNMFESVGEIGIVLPENIDAVLNRAPNLKGNFEKKLLFLGIICCITLLLKTLRIREDSNKVALILQRLRFAFQWNILISGYISVSGDVILFSLKKLQKFQMDVWTLICVSFILLTILVLMKILEVSRSEFEMERWRFVYEIYKSENLGQQLFVFIYLLRVVLVSVILSFLDAYPRFQVFILMGINFGMVLYLVCASPIQKSISKVQHMITEATLLFYYMILGISMTFFEVQDERNILGRLMTISYLITPLITAVIIIFKLLKNIYNECKEQRLRVEHVELHQMGNNGNQSVDEGEIEISNENVVITNENDDRNFVEEEDDVIEPCVVNE